MSNAPRKTRARAPKPGTTPSSNGAASTGAGAATFECGYGGRMWRWRTDGITPKDVADCRNAIGLGAREVMKAMRDAEIDLDTAAAMVFLARRQSDPTISFDAATEGLSYATPFNYGIADGDDTGDPDSPSR